MAVNKIDRINREIKKTREKISAYQTKLKDLEAQKTEAENLEIIQLVRSVQLTPAELRTLLKESPIPGMKTVPDANHERSVQQEHED